MEQREVRDPGLGFGSTLIMAHFLTHGVHQVPLALSLLLSLASVSPCDSKLTSQVVSQGLPAFRVFEPVIHYHFSFYASYSCSSPVLRSFLPVSFCFRDLGVGGESPELVSWS